MVGQELPAPIGIYHPGSGPRGLNMSCIHSRPEVYARCGQDIVQLYDELSETFVSVIFKRLQATIVI